MKNGCHDELKRRDQAIFQKYEEIINNYGNLAKRFTKQSLYEEVAEFFFLTPHHIGTIIQKKLKEKSLNAK